MSETLASSKFNVAGEQGFGDECIECCHGSDRDIEGGRGCGEGDAAAVYGRIQGEGLQEADACYKPGEIGALLHREGLYVLNLKAWREQRRTGELAGLAQKKRGPAPKATNPLVARVAALETETARLNARAAQAEALVELQKKVSKILGIALKRNGEQD